jgi:hypothetical protein
MAKADAPKRPKPKSKPKVTDKEQSERFIETARAIGADESGEQFKRASEKILVAKPALKPSGRRA